jgi:hypothetical protein
VAIAQTRPAAGIRRSLRPAARVRALASDRTNLALFAVFLLASVFYLWRSANAEPLALHGGASTPYNQLADAFLHLRLWVVNVPAEALGPGNPYNPAQRSAFLFAYPDYSLYGHYLYITWGPAPVLTWVLPLHLLGFEPSASVISTPFAIVGLAFALATLRVILRRIGDVSLWMCVLAALTVACASVVPYIMRFPLVYHEAVAGGYCFAMAGIWFGVSAVSDGRASPRRLALTSLCLGLATDSRPTLGLTAVLFAAVYVALRATRSRRGLLLALGVPFGVCVLLLAAYNQARFGSPFEYGTKYQINGISTFDAHFGELSFLGPGLWSYLIAPPRLNALFPFFLLNSPQASYPFSLPAHYGAISEETGGLLPMAPIAVFLAALPWIWRRRPRLLGPLGPFLVTMAVAGFVCMAFLAYEFYISTERYETDYMTLLLFGALAAWLALSSATTGRRRRLIRTVGGVLAVWSCATGMASAYLEVQEHPGTWRTLVNLGSPLSRAIAAVAGHPVLAEVHTLNQWSNVPSYGNLGTEVTGFWLTASNRAEITIVSPERRADALLANAFAGAALGACASPEVRIEGPGHASRVYRLAGGGALARIPVELHGGVNRIVLSPVGGAAGVGGATEPEAESEPEGPQVLMALKNLHLASG